MPLSSSIQDACTKAVASLENFKKNMPNRGRDNDRIRDILFFADAFKDLAQSNDDAEFISKLYLIINDFQKEGRSVVSDEVLANITVFHSGIKGNPHAQNIELLFRQITHAHRRTPEFSVSDKTRNCIQKYQVLMASYLNSVEISSASFATDTKKFTTSFMHAFSPSQRITKSSQNPKVKFSKNLDTDLKLLVETGKYIVYDKTDGFQIHDIKDNSKESVLAVTWEIIYNRLEHANLSDDKGHFFSTVNLIKNDIQSELSTGRMLNQASNITANEIEKEFAAGLASEKKEVMRFEPAHIMKKGAAGIINSAVGEIQTLGGEDEKVIVTSVRKNINVNLYGKYEQEKVKLAKKQNNKSDAVNSPALSEETLDASVNEVLLYHGTTVGASVNIFESGFNKPKEGSYLSIAGPLGTGVYMTDSAVKSGTFATCPLCGQVSCSCKIYSDQKVERCVIISKVAMGDTFTTSKKGVQLPHHCDTLVGRGKGVDPQSDFRSTEVCIKDPGKILPLYEVKYFTYKNMMLLNKWPEDIPQLTQLRQLITEGKPQKIKSECIRLLKEESLAPAININLNHFIDQINIEERHGHNQEKLDFVSANRTLNDKLNL